MKKRTVLLFLAVSLLVLASSCTKPACTEGDYANFQVMLDSPADGSTVPYGEPITFTWHHQEDCEPYRYILYIYDPVDDMTAFWTSEVGATQMTEHLVTILSTKKMFPVLGREYHWYVAPAGEDWGNVQGEGFLILSFTYGAICEPGELNPPQLIEPADGSWATSSAPKQEILLNWSVPGECYPEEYVYQVATDPDFNHTVMVGTVKTPTSSIKIPVPGCAHLYWRVRSEAGNSSSAWSETYDFYYAKDNNCWFTGSPGDGALIRGTVFADECNHTTPVIPLGEEVVPPCEVSPFGVHADGVPVLNSNSEPGIANVKVKLGSGPCPAVGLDEFSTMKNGMYYFNPLAPGDYCLSISKADNPALEEGLWTLPLTDQVVAEQTITLGPGDGAIYQHFGWDKNDFAQLNFSVNKLSTCRQTDNKESPAVMYLEEGAVVPVIATNQEKTWFLTVYNCFVSIATGEAQEGNLPLYPEQPSPIVDTERGPGGGSTEQKPCSSYTSGPRSCPSPRCVWVYPSAGPGYCTEND